MLYTHLRDSSFNGSRVLVTCLLILITEGSLLPSILYVHSDLKTDHVIHQTTRKLNSKNP